ncbi:hypothetical protein [Ectopseudomonas khazarica]|uniref:hypothetical protein n=1 Tax=Ectopseudomonas khazarica TaxID=2502979 RepID=UPI0037CC7196
MNQLKQSKKLTVTHFGQSESVPVAVSSVTLSELKLSRKIEHAFYSFNNYKTSPVVESSERYFSISAKDVYWIDYCSEERHGLDVDLWQLKVLQSSNDYFASCEGFARPEDLLSLLDTLSDFYPLPRRSKIIEDLRKYLPEIISGESTLRDSTILKSIFSLVLYSPHLPDLHNRLYYDEANGCLGLNFKKHGSVMNLTVKGNGEFIYSVAFKGKSVSTFSGRAVIRNNKDSGKINKIFRILYGDKYFGAHY